MPEFHGQLDRFHNGSGLSKNPKAKEQYAPVVLVFSNVHLHNKCKSGPEYCQSSTEILITAEDLKQYRYRWNSGWVTFYLLPGLFGWPLNLVALFLSQLLVALFKAKDKNCSCMSPFYICVSSVMILAEIAREKHQTYSGLLQ